MCVGGGVGEEVDEEVEEEEDGRGFKHASEVEEVGKTQEHALDIRDATPTHWETYAGNEADVALGASSLVCWGEEAEAV